MVLLELDTGTPHFGKFGMPIKNTSGSLLQYLWSIITTLNQHVSHFLFLKVPPNTPLEKQQVSLLTFAT